MRKPARDQMAMSFDDSDRAREAPGSEGETPEPQDLAEEWRPVDGWPGYEVSNWGFVRSWWGGGGKGQGRRGLRNIPKLIGGYLQKSGHSQVVMYRNHSKETRRISVHILVLETFVGPRPEGMEACHDDGDPANNRIDNLRWDTPGNNQRDTLQHGTHRHAKLTEEDIPVIWRRLVAGEAATAIAKDYKVSGGTITNIRTGKQWTHITSTLPSMPPIKRKARPIEVAPTPVYIPPEFSATEEEIWRPVPDWPPYRISNQGRVQTCLERVIGGSRGEFRLGDTWTDRAVYHDKAGYPVFSAYYQGKFKTLKVHRVVLLAFAGPCPSGMMGCHIDGDKANCRASNLRWDTGSANMHDWKRHRSARRIKAAIEAVAEGR